jgi:hypothetical protein
VFTAKVNAVLRTSSDRSMVGWGSSPLKSEGNRLLQKRGEPDVLSAHTVIHMLHGYRTLPTPNSAYFQKPLEAAIMFSTAEMATDVQRSCL